MMMRGKLRGKSSSLLIEVNAFSLLLENSLMENPVSSK